MHRANTVIHIKKNTFIEPRKDFCLLKLNYSSHNKNFSTEYNLCAWENSFLWSKCPIAGRHKSRLAINLKLMRVLTRSPRHARQTSRGPLHASRAPANLRNYAIWNFTVSVHIDCTRLMFGLIIRSHNQSVFQGEENEEASWNQTHVLYKFEQRTVTCVFLSCSLLLQGFSAWLP